jgi:crotonobetainyl-CoA:carnitine CoA-transferase CaiB-like acyl-CoA transferase
MMGPFFSAINRNKRSITVNLRSDKGREICYRLARWADVVTEGFRPGVVKRLGIDYERLSQINPGLIYASISGYGQDGPYRDRPGHDLSYQGMTGILSDQVAGTLPPLPIADLSSAMFAALGIIAALYNREKRGKGQYVDISMTDGLVSWMSIGLMASLLGAGDVTKYGGIGLIDPGYGIFETKDKKHMTLSIAFEDHFWRNLCGAIGREDMGELAFPQRVNRREELINMLKDAFLAKTRDEWADLLYRADVPSGPAYAPVEVINDPHFREHGMFVEIDDPKKGKIKHIAPPLRFSETPAEIKMPSPEVGEHTEEILLGLGYSKKEIEEMQGEGII